MESRLEVLERFCRFVERDPDAIIAECEREVEGGKRIRIKGRRFYSEQIAEFQAKAPGDARAQARAANVVRSFFIHNGIFMQAVWQATDEMLAPKDDAYLQQTTTVKPLGEMPILNAIGNMCLTHGFTHLGEIQHLRGLQGLRGMAI